MRPLPWRPLKSCPLDIQIFNTLIIMLSEGMGPKRLWRRRPASGPDERSEGGLPAATDCTRFSLSFLAMDLRMPKEHGETEQVGQNPRSHQSDAAD